ncbi:MAG: PUA domain-containing protein, partial [Devosia sp.]
HLPIVPAINPEIEAMAGGAASHLSRGGMTTKIEAGKIATLAGTAMIIARGTEDHPLRNLQNGGRHTLFAAIGGRAQARKRWIMGTLDVTGFITVDAGAAKALLSGKSLLPIGVVKVKGEFDRGDTIAILDPEGREIARGIVGLGHAEADLVKGKNSARVAEILGLEGRSELVHRDNMVVLMGSEAKLA